MSSVEAVFFDCDGTLVDSEVICSKAYVYMFAQYGIDISLAEIFERFKGVKLYDIIDIVCKQYGKSLPALEMEVVFRQEVARLFDTELQEIAGASALLAKIQIPMCIVSNGPVSKMHHSLGNTGLLHYFPEKLYSGYDIQCWKPDPALMFHAADEMGVRATNCILIDDSIAGAQSGIAAGMEVFYFCADPHNPPISHPKVTTFTHLDQLPDLWRARGWNITAPSACNK